MTPSQSYIICASPRTGSYLLCDALRSTGLAGEPTEFISDNYERYWSERWKTANYIDFLNKVTELGTTPNGVFGVKAHYYQFMRFLEKVREIHHKHSTTPAELAARFLHAPSYIWLRRRDRIGQAVSYLKALQTDVWWHADIAPAPYRTPRPANLRFDFLELNRLIGVLDRQDQEWQRFFKEAEVTPLELFYEDLVVSLTLALIKILTFLKIDAPLNRIFGQIGMRKLADHQSHNWAERYRALFAAQFERSLPAYKNIHPGSTMLVCGLGESLNLLEKPGQFITIGVNDIGRKFHPDFLIVADKPDKFSQERFHYVKTSRAGVVFTNQRGLGIAHPNIVQFLVRTDRQARLPEQHAIFAPERPWYTPYLGVVLAAHMGATSIGLIGVDFSDNHFYGHVGHHHGIRTLDYTNDNFRSLHGMLLEHGIKLFNLSPISRLSSVPFCPLDEFAGKSRRRSTRSPDKSRPMRISILGPESAAHQLCLLAARIATTTPHHAQFIPGWATENSAERSAIEFDTSIDEGELLRSDVVILHNGHHFQRHRDLLSGRAVVTLVDNPDRTDWKFVHLGYPAVTYAGSPLPARGNVMAVPQVLPEVIPAIDQRCNDSEIVISFLDVSSLESGGDTVPNLVSRTLQNLKNAADQRPSLRIVPILRSMLHTKEAVEILSRSHIYIGDVMDGGFGQTDLLALACGAVAVADIGGNPLIRQDVRQFSRTDEIPFIQASARRLEAVLVGLLRRGAIGLSHDGASGKRWISQNWIFERDWEAVWLPILSKALRVRSSRNATVRLPDRRDSERPLAAQLA